MPNNSHLSIHTPIYQSLPISPVLPRDVQWVHNDDVLLPQSHWPSPPLIHVTQVPVGDNENTDQCKHDRRMKYEVNASVQTDPQIVDPLLNPDIVHTLSSYVHTLTYQEQYPHQSYHDKLIEHHVMNQHSLQQSTLLHK